jgi:hypothetical protein
MTGLTLETLELDLEGSRLVGAEQAGVVVDPGRQRTDVQEGLARRRDERPEDEEQDAERGADQNWTAGGLSPTSARASKVAFGSAPMTLAVSTAGNDRTRVL